MAHLHNHFRNRHQPSTLQSIGNKVKNAAEFVALAKGAWDIGRSIYHGAQAIPPIIGPAIGAALI
jgi:hypothetical protein